VRAGDGFQRADGELALGQLAQQQQAVGIGQGLEQAAGLAGGRLQFA